MDSTSTSRFKPALLAALLLGPSPAVGADLTVAIGALSSLRGSVHVALYAEAGGFPTREGVFQDRIVRASEPWATFGALPPGTYAVAVYHDENDNGAFDKGLFGLPEEGYGFIATADGRELYFSRENVVHPTFDDLAVGTEVQFLEEMAEEGPQAKRISVGKHHIVS